MAKHELSRTEETHLALVFAGTVSDTESLQSVTFHCSLTRDITHSRKHAGNTIQLSWRGGENGIRMLR